MQDGDVSKYERPDNERIVYHGDGQKEEEVGEEGRTK